MAFEEIKEHIAEADASLRDYFEKSGEYYRLKGFKFMMQGITAFTKVLLISAIGFIALFFLSLAASFGIGQSLHNTFYGFLCVGMFYVLIGLIAYGMRHRLDKPLLKKFSEYYFEES